MLVVSRRIDEELKIGDNIIIKVIDIDKNQVKIGIDAPRDITILRMELVKEITKQNKLSTLHTSEDDIHTLADMIKNKKD
ncbi:MAG: carbon storage regulator CsrA [Epsilonproteobacteria bacterium]|nr:carbon storage regulator CsrA [Campylobacterota bacterium]